LKGLDSPKTGSKKVTRRSAVPDQKGKKMSVPDLESARKKKGGAVRGSLNSGSKKKKNPPKEREDQSRTG